MRSPDLKKLISAYLADAIRVRVVSTRPENEPEFVRVIATGGQGRSNRVQQHVQFTIDSYSTSTQNAWQVANSVDEAMHSLPQSDVPVSHVQGSTPADNPDPDTASPRYSATYQLTTLCR